MYTGITSLWIDGSGVKLSTVLPLVLKARLCAVLAPINLPLNMDFQIVWSFCSSDPVNKHIGFWTYESAGQ